MAFFIEGQVIVQFTGFIGQRSFSRFFVSGSGNDRWGSGWRNSRFHIPGVEAVKPDQHWYWQGHSRRVGAISGMKVQRLVIYSPALSF